MRILLAGLFVFGAMLGTAGLVHASFPQGPLPWWAKVAPGAVLLLALVLSMFIFNRTGLRPSLRRQSIQERIAELEAKNMLIRQPFEAKRAFGVSEFEDEGLHYYIELTDGQVLYLSGQYLYEYEPIDDDPDLNQPRSFPCTKFEVLRHKVAGYVIHIHCEGQVLEPEIMAPPFSNEVLRDGVPDDGQVIGTENYDTIKQRSTQM